MVNLVAVDFSNLIRQIPSYRIKFWLVWCFLAGLVKAGNVDEAIKLISSFPDAELRFELLSELSQQLADSGDCENALKILMSVKDNDQVLYTLLDIWCIDERVKEVLERFEITGERIKQATKSFGSYYLLEWLILLVKAGRVDEALETAKGFEEAGYRADALMRVAVALAEMGDERYNAVLFEALDATDFLCDFDSDELVSNAVKYLASSGKGASARELANNILDSYSLASTLVDCLPYFEKPLLEDIIDEVLDILDELDEEDREEILTSLFLVLIDLPELDKPSIERIIERISLEDVRGLLKVWYGSQLLKNNDENFRKVYKEGMDILRKVTGIQRVFMASALVPIMGEKLTTDIIKYINEIPDVKDQAFLLRELSNFKISTGEVEEALKIARSITVEGEKSLALHNIVDELSGKEFERALNIANEIPDRDWRERAFSILFAKTLDKGEFKEELFKKITDSLVKSDEENALPIIEHIIISLTEKDRKELENLVNIISKLDYLNPLRKVLKYLIEGDLENALKAAREECLGYAKILAFSAIAVKAFHTRKLSPRKLLNEARREIKRLKDSYVQSHALTAIAFASALTMQVEQGFEIILDEVPNREQEMAAYEFFSRLPVAGRVDDAVKLIQRLDKKRAGSLLHSLIMQVISYVFRRGYRSEAEKMLDPLTSFDPYTLPYLTVFFGALRESTLLQKLAEKQMEDKFALFSILGLVYSLEGKVEQGREAFSKAFEEMSKIPKHDEKRFDALCSIIENILLSAEESYVELGKNFLEEDELELLSELMKALKNASENQVEEVRKIFQNIKEKHLFSEVALYFAIVVAHMKDENSLTLLKEIVEDAEIKELLELELSSIFVPFIMAGGNPKIAVQLIEENWIRSEDILTLIAKTFTYSKNLDKFKEIINNMNKYNREKTINANMPNIEYCSIEEILELMKDISPYTKDKILSTLTEKYARIGKIEEALDTASKIVNRKIYIHALNDIFLTIMEKLAKQ